MRRIDGLNEQGHENYAIGAFESSETQFPCSPLMIDALAGL